MFWYVGIHNDMVDAADILLYQPSTKRLFYVSFST